MIKVIKFKELVVKPYYLKNTATGEVSKENFYTRKSAKHAMKRPIKWLEL